MSGYRSHTWTHVYDYNHCSYKMPAAKTPP